MAENNNTNIQYNPSTTSIPGVYYQGLQLSSEVPGTYHYADASRLFELQRKNNFEIIINDLDGIVTKYYGSPVGDEYDDAQEVLRLTTFSAPIPHFTQEVIRIKRGNNEIKYAGVPTFKEGSLKVYDTIGPNSKGILMAWQALSYDVNTEKVGLSHDYKKNAILTEYTPDWQPLRQWKLEGCWVSGVSEEDADWSQGGYKTVTATLVYDKALLLDTLEFAAQSEA